MTANELMKKVTNYEETRIIFMNFSVDENKKVWGLPEGDRTQHGLNLERLTSYKEFLSDAIKHYENIIRFDPLSKKKLDKYKRYMKRLETAMNKL